MSFRTVLVVVLALVFGVSAAAGINCLRAPQPAAVIETVPVVVAAAVGVLAVLVWFGLGGGQGEPPLGGKGDRVA
jgi:hypothetical protein